MVVWQPILRLQTRLEPHFSLLPCTFRLPYFVPPPGYSPRDSKAVRDEAARVAQSESVDQGVPETHRKANLKALKQLVPVHAFTAEGDCAEGGASEDETQEGMEDFDDEIISDDDDDDEEGEEGEEGDEEGEESEEGEEVEEDDEDDSQSEEEEAVKVLHSVGKSEWADAAKRPSAKVLNAGKRKEEPVVPTGGVSWEDVFNE